MRRLLVVVRAMEVILTFGLLFPNVVHWQVELIRLNHFLTLVHICSVQTILLLTATVVVLMVRRHPKE